MRVLVVNASPKGENSHTLVVTRAFLSGFPEGTEIEMLELGKLRIRPCTGCLCCWTKTPGQCVQQDDMQRVYAAIERADVIIESFPLYFYGLPGPLKTLTDRCLPYTRAYGWSGNTQHELRDPKMLQKKLVLISTIDIFKTPKGVDENSPVDTQNLHPYGYNRYLLEQWVREKYPDALIIRLPGLFGKNIKKNFIYDFIHVIPFMLKEETFEELVKRDGELRRFYSLQENGFYKVNVSAADRPLLKEKFRNLGFSALNFTDSRSKYQFYNLSHLWGDINTALDAGITLWHPATEPVTAGELYFYLTGEPFANELHGIPAEYDYKTRFGAVFGGQNGYIQAKEAVLKEIGDFVKNG